MENHELQVLRRQILGHVDGATLEGDQALAGFVDGQEHQVLHLRRAVPIIRIGPQRDALAPHPFDETERSGADGMAREIVAPPGHRLGRDDANRKHREVGEERRIGAFNLDPHRVRVDFLDAHDVAEGGLPIGEVTVVEGVAEVALAVEREHHRVGVERRAVVEAHPVPQEEGPFGAGRRDHPRGCQGRFNLGRTLLEADQMFEDLLAGIGALAVGHVRRIEADGVGRPSHHERAASRPAPRAAARK